MPAAKRCRRRLGLSPDTACRARFLPGGSTLEQLWAGCPVRRIGKALHPEMVSVAREGDMEEFARHNVYRTVPIEECWRVTGSKPVQVKWVDINKGDAQNPEYRSRLVAKEIKRDSRDDIFAATPPIEALNMLLGMAVTEGIGFHRGKEEIGMKLEFIDIKRAFFHATSK